MNLKYVNKIKANIAIYSNKKTANILDGSYKSVYKGKSMNFENLREYVINDEVKDIDWKASARSGTLLIKQFIAEKKHNIMLVFDTGLKMDAVSDKNESKKDLALFAAGTIGYLAIKNGDYIADIFATKEKIIYNPFKYNLYNLETYLCEYDKYASNINDYSLNDLLKYLYKNLNKKMIIFVITDIDGINKVDKKVLKTLNQMNDILFININDSYLCDDDTFDIDDQLYIPDTISHNNELIKVEKEIRDDITNGNNKKLKELNISHVSISSAKEINTKIIKLLEEHRYAAN